jgi:NAD(P)-dependent dehydrogenase (short-subunit alcohol dehydrogenase family)
MAGAGVVVNDVAKEGAADALVRAIKADGGQALAIPADVFDKSRLKAMFEPDERVSKPMDIGRISAGWRCGWPRRTRTIFSAPPCTWTAA